MRVEKLKTWYKVIIPKIMVTSNGETLDLCGKNFDFKNVFLVFFHLLIFLCHSDVCQWKIMKISKVLNIIHICSKVLLFIWYIQSMLSSLYYIFETHLKWNQTIEIYNTLFCRKKNIYLYTNFYLILQKYYLISHLLKYMVRLDDLNN